MAPMTAVWILALPLMDTVVVMIRRIRAGHNSPFAADRQHLHHLALSCGLSDGRATALLLIAAFMTGAAGVAAHWLGVPEYLQFYAFLALFGLYYRATTHLWDRQQSAAPPRTGERRRAPHSEAVVMPTAFHQVNPRD